jgi:hypothetical protein
MISSSPLDQIAAKIRRLTTMARAKVKEVSYFKILSVFGPNTWRCHVYTDDGDHYEGEGYTKGEARKNAMDALRGND